MSFLGLKKRRTFNISDRLHPKPVGQREIKFDRLPKKKLRPIWRLIFIFVIVLWTFFYLRRFLSP